MEPKKRGGPRAGAGRKATGITPQVSIRLGDEERAAYESNGGPPYVRRLIREDLAGSKISRQALLDWITQREESLGEMAAAELRAFLETQ